MGKQVQKSVYGTTQSEVRKKLQQVSVDLESGTYTEPAKMTLTVWLDIWLKDYNKEVKERTLNLYTGQVNHRIKPALGAVRLAALRPHDIQAFLNQQGNDTKGRPALAPKSIVNLHGILHKALQQAVLCGYIKINPSDACKLPRVEKSEITVFDNEQITALLRAIQGHQYEILYKVDLFTGIRQGEILGLTWDCVQKETLYLYRQLQLIKGVYKFTSLKNDRTRRITPAPAIMRLLQEQKRRQSEWQLKAGSAWNYEENFVFTDELGNHLARQTVYQCYKRIMRSLGIPEARFH